MLGKQTIDMYNNSVTKGNNPSYGMNYQRVGRELFTPDELGRLAGNKCILLIKGVKPFYSDKYKIERHKRYKQLADYDKKNTYVIEKEISMVPELKSETETEHYEF